MKMRYPEYYYGQVYGLFLDKTPRVELLRTHGQLSDDEYIELQNFIGDHQKLLYWSTNIGIMEVASMLVESARENMNIGPEGLIERDEN